MCRDRRDVNNGSACVLFDKLRKDSLDGIEDALNVDGYNFVVGSLRDARGRLGRVCGPSIVY